jgi:type IV secretory pathway component VirB8
VIQAGSQKNEDAALLELCSILSPDPTPNTEEYDIDFNVTLTSKNNTYVKNHWHTYKYISSYKKCGLFSEEVTELPLNLRVVRYKLFPKASNLLLLLLPT